MTNIAIITDTHYGARKGSKYFHEYFEQFYNDIFFPALEEYGIKTVIHMGDAFDSRKSIDYQSLEWAKRVVFDPLKKYKVHAITGNHDCYYKNTNEVNSPELLLTDYPNIKTYSSPKTIKIDGLSILMLPWICTENYDESLSHIKKSKAKVVMGHLEINGFRATRGHMMETGMDVKVFNKFDKVYSGHYHMRSNKENIFYLGNPYEMYWNDVNDRNRGFHLFDTDTLEHTPVNNPYQLFHNLYYEDTPHQMLDITKYDQKILKVIVRKKSDPKQFEKYIDKLYSSNLAELKIVENFDFTEGEEFEADESEDTISLLNRYIQESEVDLDKSVITEILQDVYREACEVE